MNCIAPLEARELTSAAAPDAPAWRAHLAKCAACRAFEAALAVTACADQTTAHPAADTLLHFDEAPESLSPRVRDWIAAHLRTCTACSEALARTAELAPVRPSRFRRWAWPLAAAAGWMLVTLLVVQSDGAPATQDALLQPHSVVLSAARGADSAAIPATARWLRLRLVLPEETPIGSSLHLRIENAAGTALIERTCVVAELDERDWPVLLLDRQGLPAGPLRILVRTPSGQTTNFALTLP